MFLTLVERSYSKSTILITFVSLFYSKLRFYQSFNSGYLYQVVVRIPLRFARVIRPGSGRRLGRAYGARPSVLHIHRKSHYGWPAPPLSAQGPSSRVRWAQLPIKMILTVCERKSKDVPDPSEYPFLRIGVVDVGHMVPQRLFMVLRIVG